MTTTNFILAILATFGLSSAILYSELFKGLREWWFVKFRGYTLEHLLRCQLCISFYISIFFIGLLETDGIFFNNIRNIYDVLGDIFTIFTLSISISGISWLLGALTLAALWIKAMCEKVYKDIERQENS